MAIESLSKIVLWYVSEFTLALEQQWLILKFDISKFKHKIKQENVLISLNISFKHARYNLFVHDINSTYLFLDAYLFCSLAKHDFQTLLLCNI